MVQRAPINFTQFTLIIENLFNHYITIKIRKLTLVQYY